MNIGNENGIMVENRGMIEQMYEKCISDVKGVEIKYYRNSVLQIL